MYTWVACDFLYMQPATAKAEVYMFHYNPSAVHNNARYLNLH